MLPSAKLWLYPAVLIGVTGGCGYARSREAAAHCEIADRIAVSDLRRHAEWALLGSEATTAGIRGAAGIPLTRESLDTATALVDQPAVCAHVAWEFGAAGTASRPGSLGVTVLRIGRVYWARTSAHGFVLVLDRRWRRLSLPIVDL